MGLVFFSDFISNFFLILFLIYKFLEVFSYTIVIKSPRLISHITYLILFFLYFILFILKAMLQSQNATSLKLLLF